jgi:chromosome segregation ATPase
LARVKEAGVEHGGFTPGSIKKIELWNFMTHVHTTMYPTSSVNLLLGANGSGKSSIVCAICLGLAGKPKNMVRGDDMASFILTGKGDAKIEVSGWGKTRS